MGIFDSGIGGLTVAKAIHENFPNENIVYFGDTAHLPYGDKSEAAIQAYSIRIADLLLKMGCKVIVIACNSASSASYELLKEYVNKQAHVINVIDPMVQFVSHSLADKRIGLIGTKRTVQSGIYQKKLAAINPACTIHSLATPLLAPMIEEGFYNSQISHEIVWNYLSDPILQNIDALILACTHYPLIRNEINEFYKGKVNILDSTQIIVESLMEYLTSHQLFGTSQNSELQFLVSDYTESFEASTQIFFQEKVSLKWHPLWN
ncbi:MAG: glutamate racemase [Cyclobacteriaceae bacterium]|nr:glutamate racemase [Cyclobacteriaceae bacterium]